ncbi:peptide chain release factor N(5)-glutamine methyltransferase [Treponema sp. HNW]|uniref:peptide chain release factor N(5)-glutamine methyltransferase n=1 Tax=Treponema sp. HNW TaxID=3116654 RepID=UPI003D0C7A85
MTLREARKEAVRLLSSADFSKQVSPTAALDADCILCNLLHTNRSFLLAHDDKTLSPSKQKAFFKRIAQRGDGLPVAYITGHKEFFGFDFCVSPAVLIPKPDTELLVELALDEIKTRAAYLQKSGKAAACTEKSKPGAEASQPYDGSRLYIADVCTGSGCIILALLKTLEQNRSGLFKNIRLISRASDISETALFLARKNAARLLNRSEIEKPRFFCADLLAFGPPAGRVSESRYDIIVSNPPYVPSGVAAELLKDGRNEPLLALDGGKDGTDIIRRLITQARHALKEGGVLLLETGEYNAADTRDALTKAGFSDIITFKDLSGLPRVTRARKII